MADTYFASFCLGDPESGPPSFNEVVGQVRAWALQSRSGIDSDKLAKVDFGASDDHVAGAGRLQVRRSSDGDADLLALRLSHPDSDEPALLWESELILAHEHRANQLRVAARTSCGHVGDYVAPIALPAPSRPRVVKELVQKFGAFEGQTRLTSVAIPVTPGDFEKHFIAVLENPERAVPLVVVSTRGSGRPAVDPRKVADQLVGLAVVCAFESKFVSFRLTDALGEEWTVRDGAVRIYWPKLRPTQLPTEHPTLFFRGDTEGGQHQKSAATRLLELVSRAATLRAAPGLARWSEIERRVNAARLKEARDRGDQLEFMKLLEEEVTALSRSKGQLEQQVSSLDSQLHAALEDADKYKGESAYWRGEYLKVQKAHAEDPQPQPEAEPLESVSAALERAEQTYQERLAIRLNSASDKDSPFQDAPSLYKALVFLATKYVDAKQGTRPCPDLDAECRKMSGFQYKSGQSAVTVGRNRSDYETTWKGEKIPVEEHLSRGTDRDPRHTIRVGFYFDRKDGRVVIGYVGQHQTTRQS